MISSLDFVQALVNMSAKASEVARLLHPTLGLVASERELQLKQEKDQEDKNHGFEVDFKTLADVLIQELVCHDIHHAFLGIPEGHFYGEENGEFEAKVSTADGAGSMKKWSLKFPEHQHTLQATLTYGWNPSRPIQ